MSRRLRISMQGAVGPVSTDQLAAGEAVRFLADRTGLADDEGRAAVAAELGHLPAALALAAAIITAQHLDYPAYLERLRAIPAREDEVLPGPSGAVKAAALSLEAARAADETGTAARVIAIMAMLSADGVRREMLHVAGQAGAVASRGRRVATEAVDDVLAGLAERALLTPSPDGRDVVLPRLVAAVTRSWLAGQGKLVTACQDAAAVLEARARTLDVSRDRPAARDFSEQVAALLRPAAEPAGQVGEKLARDLLRLRFLALYYLIELGDSVPQAVAVGEALTADLERMLGADDPDTLNGRNSLGAAYLAAGRPAEAISLFERTLVGLERTLGPNHPDTLVSKSNLAAAYQDAGRVGEAILLLRLTVAARERMLGDAHPDTLNSCGNLAAAYRAAGRPAEAIPLLVRTLAGRERVLGGGHPDTEAARANLNQARQDADRLPEALASADPLPAEQFPAEQFPSGQASVEQFPVEQLPAEPPAPELPSVELSQPVTETLPAASEPEPPVIVAEEPAAVAEAAVAETIAEEIAPEEEIAPVEETAVAEAPPEEPVAAETSPKELAAEEPPLEEPAAGELEDREPEQGGAHKPVPVPMPEVEIPRPQPVAGSGPPVASRPSRRRVRLPWVAAAVLVLVVASGVVGALSQLHADGHAPARRTAPAKPADAAQMAAAWVSQQVSQSVTVACDPLMCAALKARGVPTARLLVLRTDTASPRGAGVVVATPAVRSQFGSRLDSEYAPSVLAGFGSGAGQVNVQVVAPDGAVAYRAALRQDQAARKAAGTELLGNKQISATGQVRAQFAAGAVDSRLLILLPALAATHPVQVLAFGDSGPGAGPGMPLCSADLSGSGRGAGMTDADYQRWLITFIRAQLTRFPGSVAVVRQGRQTVVRVQFARPSPLGLLNG